MMSEHKNEEAIFDEALEIKSATERAAFVKSACGADSELLARVEALLKVYYEDKTFLKEPPVASVEVTLDESPLTEGPGTKIGRYKLLEKIGEGGMAVVYMAEQQEPIRRKVALKIIKLGMDTRQVIARFEAERQALAMMDHPNIAKVFDAGATETGRPYFVMELVKGTSITGYCDKNKLSTEERLELFIHVCHAVQHAHQTGIIHRDIKPSNIMVTLHDGQPTPKVIDFGIAKATNQRLTEKTLFTRYARMIGTPAYMSPEQAEMGDSEIDMRTDVYSLGVLLYELLTGTTPFSEVELRKAGYLEMQRIICEKEAVKPSTKLSTLAENLIDVAQRRGAAPDVLRKLIRNDLDWIVLKTLEKDRIMRYETVNKLAQDIRRHLNNEPVAAGPPSTVYRIRKFVRRNRVAVIIGFLVAASLAIGATTATIAVWTSGGGGKAEHAVGMVQRHVWNLPPLSNLTRGVSADGRYISYVDWTAGNLAARDLTTDTNWLVTNNSTWNNIDGWAESSVISADGKKIAYSWFNEKGLNFYDLRVVDLDGDNMRVLYHDTATFWIKSYDWSPDGKEILAYFADADKNLTDEKTGELFSKGHLVLVSVADGSVRVLKNWQERSYPKTAVFSPDGRYVAYDFGHQDNWVHHDIFLLELDGGSEIPLIEHSADDRLLGWVPDGQTVLFTSDRTSKRSLWQIEVAEGTPQASPRLLNTEFDGSPIGFTPDGSFYYDVSTTAGNVYLARLDSTGAGFEIQPEIVSSRFVGSTTISAWSNDGKFLAYRAGRAGRRTSWVGPGDWTFVIYSVETGRERVLTPSPLFRPGRRMRGPRWSPDAQSLLVCGTSQESGYGLYSIDVQTGDTTPIATDPEIRLSQAAWSPDGESIYIRSNTTVSRLDPASGEETELYQGKPGPIGLDVSPDGRWLAFYQDNSSLVVLSSTGGEPREVVRLAENEKSDFSHSFVRWTPDSQHLLYPKHNSQLWKVHVETGVQQQTGPAIENLVQVSMHPDGRQIAFTVEQPGSELWVMENFLPD